MSAVVASNWLRNIDYIWRLFGTAISFLGFGAGAAVCLLVVPMIRLFIGDESRRQLMTRQFIHGAYARHVGLMRLVGVLTYEVNGIDKLESGAVDVENGCLIVANHPSLIDVVFLLSTFRDANCVVKSSFWQYPLTARTVKAANYIPNDDPVQVMGACIENLKERSKLVLFPEGTRTQPDGRPKFGRAAATIALRAGVPIVPIRISCTPTTLTKSEPWYRIPPRQVRFEAQVLDVIDTRALLDGEANERRASLELTEKLHSLLDSKSINTGENS